MFLYVHNSSTRELIGSKKSTLLNLLQIRPLALKRDFDVRPLLYPNLLCIGKISVLGRMLGVSLGLSLYRKRVIRSAVGAISLTRDPDRDKRF